MKSFNNLKNYCENLSRISNTFIDEFLLYFIADAEKLEKTFNKKLKRYKKTVSEMSDNWWGMSMTQFTAHAIFRENGFAEKYRTHHVMNTRSSEELDFMEFQLENPWRFSLCRIIDEYHPEFFEMEDLVKSETFLLYSPGIENILDEYGEIPSFFLLISYNGKCYQTYSSLNFFRGFLPPDFFYFARQLQPDIDFTSDIQGLMEKDPLPFMLLLTGAELPLTRGKKDILIHCYSEYHQDEFDPAGYEKNFKIRKKGHIYQLALKRWNNFPHFAACYYHVKKKRFILTCMTERSWAKLIMGANESSWDYPREPDTLATPAMVTVADGIFGRKTELNPYEKHFQEPLTPESKDQMGKLNLFMEDFMETYNNHEEIDVEAMAEKSGVDPEMAADLAQDLLKKLGRI